MAPPVVVILSTVFHRTARQILAKIPSQAKSCTTDAQELCVGCARFESGSARHGTWPISIWRAVPVELLSEDAPAILGLSIGTTCYVSTDYFHTANRFEDFVLHEAAHVFHNCKRELRGLSCSRHREWLLEIDYRQRETFAYACEAYSRLLELGPDVKHRQDLLAELAAAPLPSDERVVGAEYLDILAEAVTARNGWKRILARCPAAVRGR